MLLCKFAGVEGNSYINFNGTLMDASQPVLMHSNRAFRYGDGLFETIRLMSGEILFLEKHLERLKKGMSVLAMEPSDALSFQKMYLLIKHLDQMNGLRGNGRIRLEVFREDNGYYASHSDKISFLLEATKLDPKEYKLNDTGLKIDFFNEVKRHADKLSALKSCNSLQFILAANYKKQYALDDCIMINSENNVAEAISSNVFIVKGKDVITPGLDQGCVDGVMRRVVIENLAAENILVQQKKISSQDLIAADEIFLTNVVDGIRWVGAFRQHRYFNKFSKRLLQSINEMVNSEKQV